MKKILIFIIASLLFSCVSQKKRCNKYISKLKSECPDCITKKDTIIAGGTIIGITEEVGDTAYSDSLSIVYLKRMQDILQIDSSKIDTELTKLKGDMKRDFIKTTKKTNIKPVKIDSLGVVVNIWSEHDLIKYSIEKKPEKITINRTKYTIVCNNDLPFWRNYWFWMFTLMVVLLVVIKKFV